MDIGSNVSIPTVKTKISERQKHTNEHMLFTTNDSQRNKMKMETL